MSETKPKTFRMFNLTFLTFVLITIMFGCGEPDKPKDGNDNPKVEKDKPLDGVQDIVIIDWPEAYRKYYGWY